MLPRKDMGETCSILYAENHKQKRIPCSDLCIVLWSYPAKGDARVESKISNCETNFININ